MDTIKWATLSQLKKGSQGRIGLGYNLLVEMAYENIRLSHKKIVKKLHSLEQENARLKEQVDHLSQYAHCSMDYKNKYAHGGASVCQSCYNDLKSKLQAYEKATEVGKLRQASARGYCTKRNENKELDTDLLEDICQAISKQIRSNNEEEK